MKINRRDFVKMGTVAGMGIAGTVFTDNEAFGQKKDKSKEVVAVCDLKQAAIENAQKIVTNKGMKVPKAYSGSVHAFE